QPALAAPPVAKSSRLANGIRIVSVYFQHSTNATIFTSLPMGLAADGAGQTQWAHLVEHLVIRSTVASDRSIANAEPCPTICGWTFTEERTIGRKDYPTSSVGSGACPLRRKAWRPKNQRSTRRWITR